MSRIIGLTGPTGAGKSTVAERARALGYFVIDCDRAAKEESQNPALLSALEKRFGGDIIKGGRLLRPVLAKKAFSSPENTKALNEISLPFIVKRIEEKIKDQPLVLLDAPTLFESGLSSRCDGIIGVLAPEPLLAERIRSRDGLSPEDAAIRLSARKSDEFFKKRCDRIIVNDGDKETLIKNCEKILIELKGE